MLLSLRSLYERTGAAKPTSSVGRVKLVRNARKKRITALKAMMVIALASKDIPLIKVIAAEYNRELDANE